MRIAVGRIGIDGGQPATPLDTFKTSLRAGHSVEQIMQYPIYSGALAGVGWQGLTPPACRRRISAVAKAIRWHIPVSLPHAGAMRRGARLAFLARYAGLAAASSAVRVSLGAFLS